MSWTFYRWVWRLRSPLHIGHTPAGTLNRTRLYIPARNMWAALTAEISRRLASNFPDYTGVGQALQQHVRFTYLYPAERVNGKWYAWLPRYVQEKKRFGLYWYREDGTVKPLSDRAFRRHLLHTQASTAIAAGTGAAEEGTLREVEFIHPYWQEEGVSPDAASRPVAFVGYLILQDTLPDDIKNHLENIREVYIGGEQRYGFGHLVLVPYSERYPWEQTLNCFDYNVKRTGEDPHIAAPSHLIGHGSLPSSQAQGAWEVLVRWDRQAMQTVNRILWQPGTRVEQSDNQGRQIYFAIDPDGLWRYRHP